MCLNFPITVNCATRRWYSFGLAHLCLNPFLISTLIRDVFHIKRHIEVHTNSTVLPWTCVFISMRTARQTIIYPYYINEGWQKLNFYTFEHNLITASQIFQESLTLIPTLNIIIHIHRTTKHLHSIVLKFMLLKCYKIARTLLILLLTIDLSISTFDGVFG